MVLYLTHTSIIDVMFLHTLCTTTAVDALHAMTQPIHMMDPI